ncbi:DUF72 domain-containing protein [Daejeonella oryzae]|uniref:DUF72 domain-containing protein n=1 Tax=Daejeonella oryzae TaxID=1122943 RepID=UPI001FE0F965|nr:DUF72 domain-containing protein [Daejeonella oryzae]
MNSIYTGTSGLVLPFPNKLSYPPEFRDKSRLTYYSSLFNSIEINSSFYKVPQASTVQKWAESVPPSFQFTFKVSREITHVKSLAFKNEDVDHFMQAVNGAGLNKGCLLLQFPPGLQSENLDQLAKLLNHIRQNNPGNQWKIAVEFRNPSWYQQNCLEILQQNNATIVMHDMPSSGIFNINQNTDFVYLRFHGANGDYRGSYTDDFLHEYAEYISSWKEEGRTIYVYFNNTRGEAIHNLILLNSFLEDK